VLDELALEEAVGLIRAGRRALQILELAVHGLEVLAARVALALVLAPGDVVLELQDLLLELGHGGALPLEHARLELLW
jgi:hypothetical protein